MSTPCAARSATGTSKHSGGSAQPSTRSTPTHRALGLRRACRAAPGPCGRSGAAVDRRPPRVASRACGRSSAEEQPMADVTVKEGQRPLRCAGRNRWPAARARFNRAATPTSSRRVPPHAAAASLVELDVRQPHHHREYVEVWWRRHAMPHLAENTRRSTPVGDPRPGAARWRAREARAYVDLRGLAADAARANPPVGAETIRKPMTMLQSVMALAVRDDTLPTVTVNVVAAVRRPSAPRRRGLAVWPTTVERSATPPGRQARSASAR